MSSAFRAFMTDSESDDPVSTQKPTKKTANPKPKTSKAPVPSAKPKNPEPVATKDTVPRNRNNRKTETMAPSEVPSEPNKKKFGGRGRGVKPGDTDARGKRIYDRQSGSGRGRGVKKGGGGSHNWGGMNPSYNTNVSLSAGIDEGSASEDKKPAQYAQADETSPEVKEEEEEKEPEKETFTLDQYMAQKQEKRAGKAFSELELAGGDQVDGRAYTKKDREAVNSEDVFIKTSNEKVKKKKEKEKSSSKKLVEDLGFKVKNPEGDRSSIRGRGRGRGRGGTYKRSTGKTGVDTADAQNFPSLGAS